MKLNGGGGGCNGIWYGDEGEKRRGEQGAGQVKY